MGSVSSDTAVLDRPGEEDRAPAVRTAAVLGYRPALDGLRALSVLAIVAYHAQVPGSRGAFLGVSTFFTLSGFLITTITLADHRRRGRVRITGFYARRARRLLPAAVVTIAGIAAITLRVGTAAQVIRLRGDSLSALFYVANWHLIRAGDSYGNLFQSPSMYLHFWSLAIEEQFYLAFPLVVAACLWLGRGSRKVLAGTLGVAVLASMAWSAHLFDGGAGVDRAYFGTDTRLAELAVGCLAALWWWRGDRDPAHLLRGNGSAPRRARAPHAVASRVLPVVGVAGLAGLLLAWHYVERTSGALYKGGLAAYAVLSVVVVLSCIQSRGLVPRVLSLRPLVWIGTVSYAVYLIHWPIMVVLRQRTALPWQGVLAVDLALTLVAAAVSQRVLERPVRTGRWPAARWAPLAAGGAIGAVATGVVVATSVRDVPVTTTLATTDLQATATELSGMGGMNTDQVESLKQRLENLKHATPLELTTMRRYAETQAKIAESAAPRVSFFGDSSASMTGEGVSDWAIEHLDRLAPAPSQTDLGCGLIETGKRRVDGEAAPPPPYCIGALDRWVVKAGRFRPDIAVIQLGPWDVRVQQIRPGGRFMTIDKDPALAAAMERNLDETVTKMLDHVQVVELVAPPDMEIGREDGVPPRRERSDSDPARMEAFRQLLGRVAAKHRRVVVLDLAGYLATRSDDDTLRPDGVHFTEATGREVANAWLGPEILRLYAQEGGTPTTAAR